MEKVLEEDSITPLDLITEEEVKKTLLADKGKDAQIISWKAVDFTKKGDNYGTVVTSVEVEYSINSQTRNVTYVVKLNPCRHSVVDITNVIFLKEAKFYLDLLPELNSVLTAVGQEPLQLPRCFHANLKSKKEQIYFEDLRARGFKLFDRKKGMDKDHATFVLKELAKLHAASYILQTKSPEEALEIKYDFLLKDMLNFTDNCKEMVIHWIEGHVTHGANLLKKVGGYDRAVSWVESLKPKLADILTNGMQSERFGRVCHGDCWNNNILFRYNNEGKPIEVMLLDLQLCRKASLATDLNYFLYTSLTGSVRSPNLLNFMSIYYSSYKDVMDAGGFDMHFNEDELLKEFWDKNEFGAIFGMRTLPAVLLESEETPEISGNDVDWGKILNEFRAKAMEMIDTNPMMKTRFLAIFDEMMEVGIIP